MPSTSPTLPEGFEVEDRGRWRLIARDDLRGPLREAGALDGKRVADLGDVEALIGGGREPLRSVRIAGVPRVLLVKTVRRGGALAPLLGRRVPLGRAAAEIALGDFLTRAGVRTSPVVAARLERSRWPGLAARAELMVERIDGGRDLASWLVESASPAERRAVLAAAGAEVAALHRAGVAHEDLNLRNLLIDGDGRAYVIDLGGSRRGPVTRARAVAALARLHRSAVKRGLSGRVGRVGLARFLRGYASDSWRTWYRDVQRRQRWSLPLHRVLYRLRGLATD